MQVTTQWAPTPRNVHVELGQFGEIQFLRNRRYCMFHFHRACPIRQPRNAGSLHQRAARQSGRAGVAND